MTDSQTPLDPRELIATGCRILAQQEVSYASFGHVSHRAPGSDTILIKGKGAQDPGLRFTTVDDVLEVDFDGLRVAGREGLQPPSEVFIHLGLYERNPDLTSVVHVHPEYAVALTIGGRTIQPVIGAYGGGRIAARGVPTYPRSVTVASPDLGREFAEFMDGHRIAMMQGHGATVVGDGVEDAVTRAISFNDLARLTYRALLLGEPTLIADEEVAAMRKPQQSNRTRGSAGGAAATLATWRHYCALEAASSTASTISA
jgi:L-fuculose-phosphate aldolase